MQGTCLICNSDKNTPFLQCKDHFISQETFTMYKCDDCGFIFTANAPEQDKIGEYYKSEDYISHSDTQKGLINKLYHTVRNIMLSRKKRLIESRVGGKTLLDVGCGTGYFPRFMQQGGFDAEGMEMDADARAFAGKNFGLKIHSPQELLEQKIYSKYDVITLWHVLEHLQDADSYLSWIYTALKKKGYLFIALPNCNSYDAEKFDKYWAAYDVPRHLWHFTPKTLKALLKRHNFELAEIKRLPFDAYYNSLMSAKYAGKSMALINGFFIGFISNLVSFFNPEKSSSVIYILTKAGE